MFRWRVGRKKTRQCAVCGRSGAIRFSRQAPYSVWRCTACGFAAIVRDTATVDRSASIRDGEFARATWTGKPYRDSAEEFIVYYDPLLAKLESLGERPGKPWTPPGRLLDVGCGPGFFLEAAKRRGWEVLGVDPSPFSAPYVAERFGLEVIPALLENAHLAEASFDAVSLVHSLEHLPDPMKKLSLVERLLRPSGVLFIETPNIECDSARLHGAEWSTLNVTEHTCLFGPASLALVVARTGFRTLELAAPVHAPPPHGNMLRVYAEKPGPPCATRLDAIRNVARLHAPPCAASRQSDDALLAAMRRAGVLPWKDDARELDAWITRGEAAMLVATALQLVPGGAPSAPRAGSGGKLKACPTAEVDLGVPLFPDVPRSHPAWTHIHLLRREGIVAGLHDGTFRPERFLLQGQLEQLTTRAQEWQACPAARPGAHRAGT
jgi:SAM-dependent methyltransferase